MSREITVGRGLGRRALLKRLGLLGFGAAVLNGIEPRAAHASAGPMPNESVRTSILDASGTEASFRTGPFQTFNAPAGSTIGICLLTGGSGRGQGMRQSITAVESAEIDAAGVGPLSLDKGVVQGAYRLVDGLSIVRPVELHGLSGTIIEGGLQAGDSVEVTWRATLERGSGHEQLRSDLEHFHACIIGQLAEDGRFTNQLSYIEIAEIG